MPHSLGSPTLVLVPTELEARRLADQGGLDRGLALQELCGFGPIAAAARTAQLLGTLRPARVLLIGIAGAYDVERDPVGEALELGRVAVDGVGVGEGESFVPPPGLGFPQWPGSPHTTPSPVLDVLDLASESAEGLLLSTCAASDSPALAERRRARFPEARAEDMEGFSVALACALFGVPLRIVRGVSNRAGDRAPEHWRIPAALAAARRLALEILRGDEGWSR